MIPAHLYFDGITQRGEANQFHRGSHQQAHFENASAVFRRNVDLGNSGGAACLEGGQRLNIRSHGLFLAGAGKNWLNENAIRYLAADSKPRVANLTNEVRLAAHQLDLLFFAKTKFAQAVCYFWRSGNLLNANSCAGNYAAERAEEGLAGAPVFS